MGCGSEITFHRNSSACFAGAQYGQYDTFKTANNASQKKNCFESKSHLLLPEREFINPFYNHFFDK